MAQVGCGNRVAILQRRGSDQQVHRRDGHSLGTLLAVQFARQQRRGLGVGNHFQIGQQVRDEALAAQADRRGLRPVDSVDQLGQADGRERGLLISGNRGNLAQKLR